MSASTAQIAKPRYEEFLANFNAATMAGLLSGNLETGINVCVECCDRHCGQGKIALRYIAADGRRQDYSFDELKVMSARIAHMLVNAGVKPGDVVAGMMPRTPALLALILGVWRCGAVYQPLFTAFGPKTIQHRLTFAQTRLVVTDSANRPKLNDVEGCPPVATYAADGKIPDGDINLAEVLGTPKDDFEPVLRLGDDLFLMMGTSGTTGLPKGVPVPIRAMLAFAVYMKYAVDLREDDVFWNLADPGWAYGLYYAVTGPLMLGVATTFNEAGFNAEATWQLIETLGVTNLAGAPTAYRLMIENGKEAAARLKGRMRAVSSAGEPLNPEVIRWFDTHLAVPINDHYGQTELGMVVNNHHGLEHVIHPGSAGFSMPGFRMVVLDEHGKELGPNQPGILAVDLARSPLMWFTGYLNQETPSISRGYYWTGDTMEIEADGSISFIGRADDVITSSGYRIGPFDVESALIEHPSVVEAAAIGVPDPERTEVVKAFVVLSAGVSPSDELVEELKAYVRKRVSAHAYPREVEFVKDLPKTPSGKVQRNILRNAEIAKRKPVEHK